LLLLDFGKAVGVTAQLGVLFKWAGFVEAARLLTIGIYRERADQNESLKIRIPHARFEKVARSDNGIHKHIRKRFLASPGGQVKYHRHILAHCLTIRARKKIAFENVDSCGPGVTLHNGLNPRQVAGGPDKTGNVAKSTVQQIFYHPSPYETGGACHEYSGIWTDEERIVHRVSWHRN
jgi:hypothetical protein